MSRLMQAVRWAVAGLLLLVLAASLWSAWLVWRFQASVPVVEGEIAINGLRRPVFVVRDEHGVPHVFGETERDVFFGLGYAHAQDRLFQMDMVRRAIEGRLSEVIGETTLSVDARARVRGHAHTAQALAEATSPETRAILQGYADGVNAFIAGPSRRRSPEYALLMFEPEPWDLADSMAVAIYMIESLIVAGDEFDRAALAGALTSDQIDEFLPGYPDFGPNSLSRADLGATAAVLDRTPGARADDGDPTAGSNNWVVAGRRTASGLPLLANDPHLGLGAPSTWYLARLSSPEGNVVGATVPGAPLVVLGRNDRIAWGFTNTGYDVEDYVVSPDPEVAGTRSEEIRIRFGSRRTVEVSDTADGPVLHPDWFNVGVFGGDAVVLRTTGDDRDNLLADALHGMMRARDWASFREAGRGWSAPIQNIVYADVDGHIGYHAPGRVPIRGADGDWIGEVDFDALPFVFNPPSGVIATANNKILPDGHVVDPAGSFDPYRQMRVAERLADTRLHDKASFRNIQLDVLSVQARRLMPALAQARPQTELGAAMLDELEGWDGLMDKDAAEPLIFAMWWREMARTIYQDELGEMFLPYFNSRDVFIDEVLTGDLGHWCDDVGTPDPETCPDALGTALDRAAVALVERFGFDPEGWTWGAAHVAVFAHPLFSGAPLLDGLYTVREPIGGDANTIAEAGYSLRAGTFEANHGPAFRAIYDLSDLDSSLFIMTPGQSGHPLSPHYRDLAPMWAHGDYIEVRADWSVETPPPGSRLLALVPAD